jgi:hypothetical protein
MKKMMLLFALGLAACTWPALSGHEESQWLPDRLSSNTWAHSETEGQWLVPTPHVKGPLRVNGTNVPPEWHDAAPAPRR